EVKLDRLVVYRFRRSEGDGTDRGVLPPLPVALSVFRRTPETVEGGHPRRVDVFLRRIDGEEKASPLVGLEPLKASQFEGAGKGRLKGIGLEVDRPARLLELATKLIDLFRQFLTALASALQFCLNNLTAVLRDGGLLDRVGEAGEGL